MKKILLALALASTAVAQTPEPTSTATPTPPDNTRRNANEQITAENQGGSAKDREMTKKIRRELMKADSLSAMAKNIKVITIDGKVTLRGPVHSEQEKQSIASMAEKVAGTGTVNNQLEVKKSK